MSDPVQPHRRQPTRLPCPWDSPGKNSEVGCHFLLQCIKLKSESEVAQSCPTPSNPMDCSPPGSSVHGISQGRILEWVAIFFSRGSSQFRIEPVSPALQVDSLPLSHLGIPHMVHAAAAAKSLQSCPTLCDPVDSSPPGSSLHGHSPGKNTGVGCHALLQGIFPTQGSNLHLCFGRQIPYS